MGDFVSAAYMIDYDRMRNPVKKVRYTNLILETGSRNIKTSNTMILGIHSNKYLLFDPDEREIFLTNASKLTAFQP